jgi:4-amino-4-deoxy-L-arabinose transferase-like glycosyltransferase
MAAVSAAGRRMAGVVGDVPRRELVAVAVIAAIGFAVRLAFVLLTQDHVLAGDEVEYNIEGRFIAEGTGFWSTTPFGDPHPTMWKAPAYGYFVGAIYALGGADPDNALLVQTFIGPLTIGLTWLLARHLFGPAVAIAAAAVVAIYPFAWHFEVRLFAESLATPLTLLILFLLLERPATVRRAAGIGVLTGVMVLIRPSAVYLVPGIAVAWLIAAGLRRGVGLTAVTVALACLVVSPWTIRNYDLSGAFVPISVQDFALYGVFNDDAANDPERPWGWRARTTRDRDIERRKPGELELARILRRRAFEYIEEHPDSVPKAFFWNGLSRFWDVRRPEHILEEASFTGRSRTLTEIGVYVHYLLLPLAVLGLVLARSRPTLVLPLAAIALSASVVFTANASTRFRAPFEPVIVMLAAFAVFHLVTRWRRSTTRGPPDSAAKTARV